MDQEYKEVLEILDALPEAGGQGAEASARARYQKSYR